MFDVGEEDADDVSKHNGERNAQVNKARVEKDFGEEIGEGELARS